jgi:hypothetical protein
MDVDDESASIMARSMLDIRLNLKYVEVFNTRKAIKIVAVAISFIVAILYLRFSASTIEWTAGTCGLLLAIRLLIGAPTSTRLSTESFQRLQEWLANDEEINE